MPAQTKWRLSGDYFENCNCDVVCPCLVSPAAPLTARPSQGVCDVALVFHIDKGSYDQVSLDGLNVAVVGHTPGPMADGNWTLAAYIDERADDEQTAALGAIFGGAEGGPMAAFAPLVGKHLGAKKVAIKYAINGNSPLGGNPRHHAHGGGAAAEHAPERRDLGRDGPSGRAGQARVRRGQQGQHLRRPRHAVGQFRQERPLRSDQLVELAARRPARACRRRDGDAAAARDPARWCNATSSWACSWRWRRPPGRCSPGKARAPSMDMAMALADHGHARAAVPGDLGGHDGGHDVSDRRAHDPHLPQGAGEQAPARRGLRCNLGVRGGLHAGVDAVGCCRLCGRARPPRPLPRAPRCRRPLPPGSAGRSSSRRASISSRRSRTCACRSAARRSASS